MEAILAKLLLPDNAEIALGTQQLKEAFKSPQIIPELCAVMTTSQSAQIRQYAALLLRKKFGKFKTWMKLDPQSRTTMKEGCLNSLVAEGEKSVKMSIAQLIAVIAKHELKPGNAWPELDNFLHQHLNHAEPGHRHLGMYTLSVLCETAGEQVKPLLRQFSKVFQRALQEDPDDVAFYAIRALTHLVRYVGSDDVPVFQPLLALIIIRIQKLVTTDEEKATESMEIFDELFISEVSIVVPHIKPIIELCMRFAAEEKLDNQIRVKAIEFLGRLTKLKKKTIVKNRFYISIINVLFPILSRIDDDDDGDDEEDEFAGNLAESNLPSTCACQALDVMAINLPPEKFMPTLLGHVQPAFQGGVPEQMKGAFNALAVCVEGCSEYIRNKLLVPLLRNIGDGIKHENQHVRNAALYALGQFSEFMQPEISGYAGEIIPVLFEYLDTQCYQITQQGLVKTPPGLDRIMYALEIFCENLGKKLVPFLPDLMRRLLTMLGDGFSLHTKELSISGIGAAASATQEDIVPFFDDIMSYLKRYLLVGSNCDKNTQALLTQSMDTLGTLARAVGPSNFAPTLAEECCKLGLDLITQHDDPDVRKCAYALFASVAFVVKEEMAVVLPQIIELMFVSCASKEGISFELKDTNSELPLEDLSDDDDDDEISLGTEDSYGNMENVKTIKVENAYMSEKEEALDALREICKYVGNSYLPYLAQSLDEGWKLMDYPDEDVRKVAVEACVEFTMAYYRQGSPSSMEAFSRYLVNLVPKLCHMVKSDEEVSVVCACLDEMVNLLKQCTTSVTAVAGHPEQIIQCVHLVMKSECACMDNDEGSGGEEDDMEAEQDEMLFECAGEIVPALGMAMAPSQFSPYFAGLLPHLLKKTSKHCNISERSFGAGSLAECMEPLRGVLDPYIPKLLPTFLSLTKDPEDDVRNNAVYGLGELILHGGGAMFEHFTSILQNLSALLAHEQAPRVVDQIVGAVCRAIVANRDIVPVREVLPVVMKHLPLREDDEEYAIVFRCMLELYNAGELLIKENMVKLLAIAGDVKGKGTTNENTVASLLQLVQSYHRDMKAEFAVAVGQLQPETAAVITSMVG